MGVSSSSVMYTNCQESEKESERRKSEREREITDGRLTVYCPEAVRNKCTEACLLLTMIDWIARGQLGGLAPGCKPV